MRRRRGVIAAPNRRPASNGGVTRASKCARMFMSSVGTSALLLSGWACDCQLCLVARAVMTRRRPSGTQLATGLNRGTTGVALQRGTLEDAALADVEAIDATGAHRATGPI